MVEMQTPVAMVGSSNQAIQNSCDEWSEDY